MAPKSTAAPTLGQRFARLQTVPEGFTFEELQHLSTSELGKFKVDFGKHAGLTFEEAVNTKPGWTKWMIDHMSTSNKLSHKSFLLYVDRFAQEGEAMEKHLLESQPETPEAQMIKKKMDPAKDLLKPPASENGPVPNMSSGTSSGTTATGSNVNDGNVINARMDELSSRMSNIEVVLNQIAQAMQELNLQAGQQ